MVERFSVLMSVYSKEKADYLRLSLESVFTQTIIPNEVIIVEDGPLTNEIYDAIEEYKIAHPELKIVRINSNVGLGRALNEGLKHCTYELVARMDTDDICYPNRFEKQLEIFKNNQVDIVSSWICEFKDNPSNIVSIRRLPEKHNEIKEYAKRRSPINHPAAMFRKSAVIASGGYMHFRLFEDYYLWARMLVNGFRFYNIQEPLLWFRVSPMMYKRRGGVKYAVDEIRFQSKLHKMGLINYWEELSNIGVRVFVRVIPNSIRSFIYRKLLRG